MPKILVDLTKNDADADRHFLKKVTIQFLFVNINVVKHYWVSRVHYFGYCIALLVRWNSV